MLFRSDSYIGSGVYFKRAYLKNPNNFKRDILYIGKNYRNIERNFLLENNAQYNDLFYNLKNESIGGWKHVNIEKRGIAIAKAKKGKYPEHLRYDKSGINNPMFDKKHSIETKNKISRSNMKENAITHNKSKYESMRLLKQLEKKAGKKKTEQCEICGSVGKICFDHDHDTGLFRGWICVRCNLVLGLVKDNKELLDQMIKYL